MSFFQNLQLHYFQILKQIKNLFLKLPNFQFQLVSIICKYRLTALFRKNGALKQGYLKQYLQSSCFRHIKAKIRMFTVMLLCIATLSPSRNK